MNIPIESIYCRHTLINDNLKSILHKCKHKYFKNGSDKDHYIFHMEDTIHYNALITNNFNLYNEYITKTRQSEHSVTIFKKLLEYFDINKIEKIKVELITLDCGLKKYVILDGVHRIIILLLKKFINNGIPHTLLQIV